MMDLSFKNLFYFSIGLIAFLVFNGCQTEQYDLVVLNGTIYNGKGEAGEINDIGINDGKISKIGNLKNVKAENTIDASGLAVSPGFIDLHAHLEELEELPHALSKLHQGVTTALGGPDGSSPLPMGEYLESLKELPLGINVAYLVGHNTIRKKVMDYDNRKPSAEELDLMKKEVSQAMDEGAFGLSTGLKYVPGSFSEIDEVIEISKAAAEKGGFYTSHLREEGLELVPSVREAIEIGEKADIPIVLTHHKVVGKPSWGTSKKTLEMVDSANSVGLDIQLDQYPYTASSAGISILIPSWARAGGSEAFEERTNDPVTYQKIKNEIIENILNDRGAGDIKNIHMIRVSWDKTLENKSLADWAIERELEPSPENGADLIIEAQLNGGVSCIFHAMDENDVTRIMKHPKTMIASDGRLGKLGEGYPHPRVYGVFPRVLGKYSREDKVLSLEEAIKKMSYLPALRMGLNDRGLIEEEMKADIVVFDPETIIDKATFTEPHQYPDGISHVIVNGEISVKNGKETGVYAGEILKGN